MKGVTNRRSLLTAAGTVVLAAVAGTAAAQPTDIRAIVDYGGDKVIPQGRVQVHLEDSANQDTTLSDATKMHVDSDGVSKAIVFDVPLPPSTAVSSPTLRAVARLEREDGWLLARGSAGIEAGFDVHITLNTVMY